MCLVTSCLVPVGAFVVSEHARYDVDTACMACDGSTGVPFGVKKRAAQLPHLVLWLPSLPVLPKCAVNHAMFLEILELAKGCKTPSAQDPNCAKQTLSCDV